MNTTNPRQTASTNEPRTVPTAGRWTPSKTGQILGMGLSLAVVGSIAGHLAIIAVVSLIRIVIAGAGSGPGPGIASDYEITISPVAQLTSPIAGDESLTISTPTVGPIGQPTTPGIEDAGGFSDDDLRGGPIADQTADGLGGAGSGDTLGQPGAGGLGGGGTSFFGVEARGSRFLYIVDISGSMRDDNKLETLRAELVESILALDEDMAFFVFFFESKVIPIDEQVRWIEATQRAKGFAKKQIASLPAEGGTEPWYAFESALRMKPHADAIYFMTDGEFDPVVADQIASRNRGSRKVPIHCITFGSDAAAETMRKIADQSDGTYTHVKGIR